MKNSNVKAALFVALSIILTATTVFCAIFGIFMAASQSGNDTGKPVNTPDTPPTDDTTDTPGGNTDPGGNENEGEVGKDDPAKPKKYVAFTFDDGPAYKNGLTKKLVDELTKYGGEATFFLVGDRIHSSTASNVIYAVEHGWEIGIHAYTHKHYFNSCSDDIYNSEVQKTADAIHKYLPEYDIKLLRPPGGTMSADRIAASPYSTILWNVDSRDWEYTEYSGGSVEENVQIIVQQVLSTVKDGSIILMHEIYDNSYLAFCEILKALDEEGYEFVSVSELLGDKLEPGKKYYSAK